MPRHALLLLRYKTLLGRLQFQGRRALVDPGNNEQRCWPLHGQGCIKASPRPVSFRLSVLFFLLLALQTQNRAPLLFGPVCCQDAVHPACVDRTLCIRPDREGETHQQQFVHDGCDQDEGPKRRQRQLCEGATGFEPQAAGQEKPTQESSANRQRSVGGRAARQEKGQIVALITNGQLPRLQLGRVSV